VLGNRVVQVLNYQNNDNKKVDVKITQLVEQFARLSMATLDIADVVIIAH
jgi:hypothetical protein